MPRSSSSKALGAKSRCGSFFSRRARTAWKPGSSHGFAKRSCVGRKPSPSSATRSSEATHARTSPARALRAREEVPERGIGGPLAEELLHRFDGAARGEVGFLRLSSERDEGDENGEEGAHAAHYARPR